MTLRFRARVDAPVAWTAAVSALAVFYIAFVVPLGRAPDEAEHAFRAFQIASGGLLSDVIRCASHPRALPCAIHYPGPYVPGRRVGGAMPTGLYHVLEALQGLAQKVIVPPFDPQAYARGLVATLGGARVFAHFENTALYSPANYVPAALALWVGRAVSASVVASLFAARLASGIVWAALSTTAVAVAPRWRWLFAVAVLVPTALAQGAVISADTLGLALAPLAVACALRIADGGTLPRRRQLAGVAALALLLGLLKLPLPVVVVAVVAILWPVLGSGRARGLRVAALTLPALVGAAAWNAAANHEFVPYRNTIFQASEQVRIDPSAQAHYLLTHLYEIPVLLWQTATHDALFRLDGIVGSVGQDGVAGPLPEWFGVVWLVAFATLAVAGGEGAPPVRAVRAWCGATIVGMCLVAALGIYLSWTAVGAGLINGLHGRYYTPALTLAIPLLAGLGAGRLRMSRRAIGAAAVLLSAAGAIYLFAHVSQTYYGTSPWQALARVLGAVF